MKNWSKILLQIIIGVVGLIKLEKIGLGKFLWKFERNCALNDSTNYSDLSLLKPKKEEIG
jgi:hypothetical protein